MATAKTTSTKRKPAAPRKPAPARAAVAGATDRAALRAEILAELRADLFIEDHRWFTVGPDGDWKEPGEASRALARYRILPGGRVTVRIADGVYACTTVEGHVDGDRIAWSTAGVVGEPLNPEELILTGCERDQLEADRIANEPLVRARYRVVLEFASGFGFCARGRHLGVWDPVLAINVGDAKVGITTGGPTRRYGEGSGGRGAFNGCCIYGFRVVNIITFYGGVLNDHGCYHLFGGEENSRTNFSGVIYGKGVVLIGAGDYNHRCNHGGSRYSEGAVIWNAGIAGIEVTNAAGMGWFHRSDIRGNRIGAAASWGGSLKLVGCRLRDNLQVQIRAIWGASIDARDTVCTTTVDTNTGYQANGGQIDARGATLEGHQKDVEVFGPGGVQITPFEGSRFFAAHRPVQPDGFQWVRDPDGVRPVSEPSPEPEAEPPPLPDAEPDQDVADLDDESPPTSRRTGWLGLFRR